jgi:tetratricopeptide (TPR) repeat protein
MIEPGEVFSWVNQFKYKIHSHKELIDKVARDDKSSEMSLAAAQLYSRLGDMRKKGKKDQAISVIDRLKYYALHSTNSLERGEIWIRCGMAFYEMKDNKNAEDALEHAVAEYPRTGHQRAVSRWLLGDIQWNLENYEDAAISNWSKAIEEFTMLMEQAQNDHQDIRHTWYKEKIEILKEALKEQILLQIP